MHDLILNPWLMLLFQTFTSFCATFFFAIIFNSPRSLLVPCGIVGAFGWVVYYFSYEAYGNNVASCFIGALVLGLIAHIMARYYKRPVIIFYVAGIIPLVPGGTAYDATKHLIMNDSSKAVEKGLEAMLISGAIAFGLIFAEITFQTVIKTRKRMQNNRKPI